LPTPRAIPTDRAELTRHDVGNGTNDVIAHKLTLPVVGQFEVIDYAGQKPATAARVKGDQYQKYSPSPPRAKFLSPSQIISGRIRY
jgi:hypothetical protein